MRIDQQPATAILQDRRFGRKAAPLPHAVASRQSTLIDDLRLFALTFAGGFLFVTVYLI